MGSAHVQDVSRARWTYWVPQVRIPACVRSAGADSSHLLLVLPRVGSS